MSKPRLLWLTPRPPYPANTGGNIYVLNRIQEMHRRGFAIDLVAARDPALVRHEVEILGGLRKWCASVTLYGSGRGPRPPKPLAFLRLPWGAYHRLPSHADLQTMIELARRCDGLQVEQSVMIPAARAVLARHSMPSVLALYSRGGRSLRRSARHQGGGVRRSAVLLAEALRLGQLEKGALNDVRFNIVTFVSNADLDSVRGSVRDVRRLRRVPIAVPVPLTRAGPGQPAPAPTQPTVLFLASFTDPGNVLAYHWLVERVLPSLPTGLGARIIVAGRQASSLEHRSGPDVEVISDPPDTAPLYRQASIVAVPVVAGGGVRVKLLEAVAWGRPVVTTSLGVAGTDFVAGEDLLVADVPGDFASAVNACVEEPRAARERAARALAKLMRLHRIEQVGDELETLYAGMVAVPR